MVSVVERSNDERRPFRVVLPREENVYEGELIYHSILALLLTGGLLLSSSLQHKTSFWDR